MIKGAVKSHHSALQLTDYQIEIFWAYQVNSKTGEPIIMSMRSDKVASELQREISMIIMEDLNDPRLGFVTITRIEPTEDLRFARVFLSVLGSESERKSSLIALQRAKGYIRRLVADRVKLRYAIDLQFVLDESLDHAMKIDAVLRTIKEQKKTAE